MPTLFLSYSRQNPHQIDQLAQSLTPLGISTWRDQDQLRVGQHWPKALGEAIAAANALLLLWSATSASSDFVELEWTTALALKKPILPCLLDPTPLPASLASTHAIPFTNAPETAAKIAAALAAAPTLESPPDTRQVFSQLVAIRATHESDVLKEFKVIQGSVYQAGRDIYIGNPPAPKSSLDQWQARVGILVGVLTAVSIGAALWHGNLPQPSPEKPSKQQATVSPQPFAGSISNNGSEPLPGVTVSLLLDNKLAASAITDNLGRFNFSVSAAPESEITLIAQKDGFQTEKRYAQLGNTNFNFAMRAPAARRSQP